jgi:multisubunit Na+/H+ antiporter MnhF subunit
VNAWLVGAAVLALALLPLGWVAARRPVEDGLVALQAAGIDGVLTLLLVAQGTGRGAVGDLAVVLAAASLVGSLAFAALLEREP